MAQPEAVEAPPARRRWAALTGIEAARTAVASAPASVRTKLLVAFLVIAALLVLVAVLGLRVLGQANARVERLGTLQARSSQYQALSGVRHRSATGARGARYRPTRHERLHRRKTAQGGQRWVLVDDAVLSRSRRSSSAPTRRSSSASCRRPPTSARSTGSASTTAGSTVRSARITALDRERRHGLPGPVLAGRRDDADNDLHAARASASQISTSAETTALIAAEPQRLRLLTRSLRRRRGDQRRARPRPRASSSRGRSSARSSAPRRGSRRSPRATSPGRSTSEPGRARLARREREPHERRAAAAVRRARDGEPPQERVPREHVARAAHAAERDHRLLGGAAAAAVRRDQREAGGVPRRHPLVRATTCSR